MLKVLSLFSGIGMFDYGLEKTGNFETIMLCENDKKCQEVLEKHWPDTFICNDIKDLKKLEIPCNEIEDAIYQELDRVDVVTASWPCQGHSTAGKKRGLSDERSGLWKEVKRVLQETKPKWFIGENSANLRTNGLTEVLQDLWEIGFRNIRWDILPAEAYGAIHKRERIYIIANSHGIRLDEAAYAPSKEEQVRRSKTWANFCNRKCPEPGFYRVANASTTRLDENKRKRRVKQLGNSLIYKIPESIGHYILKKEKEI